MIWFQRTVDEILNRLDSSPEGLSQEEAQKRLERFGSNTIRRGKEVSAWKVLLHQFTSPLIYVLMGALAVTLAIQSWSDVIVIAAVLVINGTVGFFQEYRAESAVQSLMQMITPRAMVRRGGEDREIESTNLVPGDIVQLDQGRMVPADIRLMEVTSLQVNEAALTGESVPVNKVSEAMRDADEDLPTADQKNMAFLGTAVTTGSAVGVVVATGGETKIGQIAEQVQEATEIETPLERRIRRLTKWITIGILGVTVVAVGIGILVGRELYEMLLLGVALAVAAIPAGLPIVVTVALALGVRRMAKRHAIIRQLPAVDSLGSTTLIVSDKTGTLTQNQMTVRSIYAGTDRFEVTGGGQSREGAIVQEEERAAILEKSPLWYSLLVGALCNEATISWKEPGPRQEEERQDEENEEPVSGLEAQGDPMEVALLVAADKSQLDRERLREQYPRKDTVPFKTERRFMATIHDTPGNGPLVLVKGAPEKILSMCDTQLTGRGKTSDLDRQQLEKQEQDMAGEGLRVLALAVGHGPDATQTVKSDQPGGLTFVGMQGMLDPPRQSAVQAVDQCHQSGIRVVMVTGDHARTAAAIARETHLDYPTSRGRDQVHEPAMEQDRDLPKSFTGQEISKMEDSEFQALLKDVNVYARVEPGQKLRLVNLLKNQNEIVAVTGDGVNDAPALKSAHIGAAMGSGTDVAKDASDMVITDDNFASVYAAVEEGRTAFRNIRMATFFLLSTGAADILIILSALAFGWPLPLLPAQILWCNVVTNGIADVALAFEPGEKALFNRPPRPPGEGVLDRILLERLALVGIWLAAGTLFMFWWISGGGEEQLTLARTAALTTLILFQKVHVFNCRSEDVSIFKKSLLANKVLFLGVLASLSVHVGALYLPWTQKLLRVTPLDMSTWIMALGIAITAILVNELHKWLRPSPGRRSIGAQSS